MSTLPKNHPAIAATYNDLNVVYERKGQFFKGLEFYQKALDINHKILPPRHPEVQRTEENFQRLSSEIEN